MMTRLRIVTGKGGVGKTTVATALALSAVNRGQRVLVCEVRGGDRVSRLLGVAPTGAHLREVVSGLSVVDMNPEDAIHEYALLTLHLETLYRVVFENRLVRSFLRLVPSLGELVMLGKLWYHEREREGPNPRYDLIVVDAPATGHALALLGTPKAVEAAVPGGPLREHARNIGALLTNPDKTSVHIVTTPEEMPVNESIEIAQRSSELGIAVNDPIINQSVAALPPDVLEKIGSSPDPVLLGATDALRRREDKRLLGEEQLERLPAELRVRALRLPRLIGPSFGRPELEALAVLLTPLVDPIRERVLSAHASSREVADSP